MGTLIVADEDVRSACAERMLSTPSRLAPMAGDVLIASGLPAGQGSVSSGHSSPVALLISAARSSRARSGSTS